MENPSQLRPPKRDATKILFVGATRPDGTRVVLVQDQNPHITRDLPHIQHHSNEFNWGYGGSGPADLALNLLEYTARLTGEKPSVDVWKGRVTWLAWQLHQDFKWQVVAHWQENTWHITAAEIYDWMQAQLKAQNTTNE